ARGYWADEWGRRRNDASKLAWEDEHHPLLATMGRLGADMQRVLLDASEHMGVAEEEPAGEPFVNPGHASALQRLQSDLLEARAGYHAAAAADRSISIHACHSPMREIEVLHDQLLSVLTVGGELEPQDVVVMLTDVEAYAPLVDAVFHKPRGDAQFIPYHIADRSLRHESPYLDAFNALIDMVGARLSATQVLDFLGREPLRTKLRLSREDLDALSAWVVDSGIRWGIDAAHRSAHGQPAVFENTWRFGLQRLLLGYAMPVDCAHTVAGVLPLSQVEGQSALVLGRFALFCDWLFDALERMAKPRSVQHWQLLLSTLIDELFAGDVHAQSATQPIVRGLSQLAAAAQAAGVTEALSVQVMRDAFNALVDEQRQARGFMAGGVTFCAMVPMRNIPFQVVCMVGMGDSDFPRQASSDNFDLTRKPGAQRAGDRNRRDDDRFLFLEAVLAARKRLIISYTGHSIRDNTVRPPSVVVSELCDYLARSQPSLAASLITHHPLQAFSPRYFQA
ncbi:MAG TPA: exonuclease V subunit gamma, partial [Sorangium sp.]|nr:exonuclease V subunit gamma [Sorangium sp.]